MKKIILTALSLVASVAFSVPVFAKPVTLVAAENFYGSVAKQIGGDHIQVISIMSNPNQDPHLFSATPSIAKAIADADIIVYNGIGYDSWMQPLLSATKNKSQQIIIVSELMNKKNGDNPHIWYDPKTMPLYAKKLTAILITQDPVHKQDYEKQFSKFNQKNNLFQRHVQQLKQKIHNISVIATEPVFNDMANALGLIMHGKDFQLSVMNDISPSPSQTQSFENNLQNKSVRVLIYNNQVSDPTTQRMKDIATKNGIPIVGVSETQEPGKNYFEWMEAQLKELEKTLT